MDSEHKILALEARLLSNMGAYLSTNGPLAPTTAFVSAIGGVYAIPAIDIEVRGVFTNTVPIDAYRGAGKPEANYIIERMIDIAAARLGTDPVELRRRNMMLNAPQRTATGMQIDGGRFGLNLEDALRRADHAGFPERRAASEMAGRLRGLGFGCFLETARGAPNEVASIRMEPDGSIVFAVGTQSNGQGHETSYAQVASFMLGLPLDRFRFRQGDTALLPGGGGHGGARSLQLGGTALVLAVEAMVAKGCSIAAHLLQARPEEITFRDGAFHHQLDGRALLLDDIVVASRDPTNVPEGLAPGLDGIGQNISNLYAYPNGCHVAEVEIDPETGSVRLCRYTLVDDYGTLVNPRLALGQIQGGVAQGIGQAMLEHAAYDAATGQFLTGSLMDYALPRASDLPDFDAALAEDVPTASNRLGVKGAGQAGCMAAPQAVMNAIMDALSAVGVRHLDMPATPLRVWQAIEAARRGKAGFAG
jgi:carbon-monoxide dehydrogenase large subunit